MWDHSPLALILPLEVLRPANRLLHLYTVEPLYNGHLGDRRKGKSEEQLPKKTVGQQSADSWPTVYRQSADSISTVGRQYIDSWPTVYRQSADRLLGELFPL